MTAETARERTRLAWRRTVLAGTVVGLLFLRLAGPGAALAVPAWLVLQYLLLSRRLGSTRAAILGALFFGLHPLQVEPVAWVSGMNGVLAGLLSLAALAVYAGALRATGRWAALAAGLLYALEPAAVVYGRTLWNPDLVPLFAALALWGLIEFWQHEPNRLHRRLLVTRRRGGWSEQILQP